MPWPARRCPPLSGRVAAVAVLGGVVPSVGPDALATGAIELARRFAPVLSGLRRPLAQAVSALLMPLIPFAHYACQAYASTTPEGDRRVLRDPEMEGMFIDDLVLLAKGRFQAIIDDARLFGRDWGFRLADVHGAGAVVARRRRQHRAAARRTEGGRISCPTPNSSCAPRRATSAALPPRTRCLPSSDPTSDACSKRRNAVQRNSCVAYAPSGPGLSE